MEPYKAREGKGGGERTDVEVESDYTVDHEV